MENTHAQFKNDNPVIFLASGDSYVGPFKPSEIYQKLQSKEASWSDYCFEAGQKDWVKLSDHPLFKGLVPTPPSVKPKLAPPPPPKKAEPQIKWYLFQNDAQTGPYDTAELKRWKTSGQVLPGAFVWQENFSEWKPFNDVSEFSGGKEIEKETKSKERRSAPRKPLVAQIFLTNNKDIINAICRDISIGGMQVLTDHIPGKVGESLRLNVTPPASSQLKPFVAEGVLVRVLEDQKGFSFRFTQISDEAKSAIERYIA